MLIELLFLVKLTTPVQGFFIFFGSSFFGFELRSVAIITCPD